MKRKTKRDQASTCSAAFSDIEDHSSGEERPEHVGESHEEEGAAAQRSMVY